MRRGSKTSKVAASLAGLVLLLLSSVGYYGVTSTRGQGQPMGVSFGAVPPLVFVSTELRKELKVCVTPPELGERTTVQLDGQPFLPNLGSTLSAARPACPGTVLGLAPQVLTPGLHRLTFTALYSGRYARSVGLSMAVGPFEDRERWISCAARIWIGQDFLDAPGHASHDVARTIEAMLLQRRFTEPCLQGAVVEAKVRIAWLSSGLALAATMRLASGDVIKTQAELGLSTHEGRLQITVPPRSIQASLVGPALLCERKLYAKDQPFIAFLFAANVANEVQRQAHQQVHASAVTMIERELLRPVRELLEAPQPLQIAQSPDAQLVVRYGELDIQPDVGALICVDVRATTAMHAQRNVPGPPLWPPVNFPSLPDRSQSLRIDLSLQAMNAALDAAWRVGLLDRMLMQSSASWADLFKDLTVRPTTMAFELPPVIQPGVGGPALTVGDLRVWLADRQQPERTERIADLYARADLSARFVQARKSVQLSARLRDFGLTCQLPGPDGVRMTPCFAEAVQILEDNLLDKPIATEAVGSVVVPLEKWLPGQTDGKAALAADLIQAELRPMAGGDWYQLYADVQVRDAQRK